MDCRLFVKTLNGIKPITLDVKQAVAPTFVKNKEYKIKTGERVVQTTITLYSNCYIIVNNGVKTITLDVKHQPTRGTCPLNPW